MPENLLTASEVTQYLRVNIETVYNLMRKADLPVIKIGGQWRFRDTDITRWVDAQSQATSGQLRAPHGKQQEK